MTSITITQNELNQMLQKAIKELKSIGVEPCMDIKPKVRTYPATSYLGQCRKKDNQFEITISKYHLPNGHEAVMETIMHEIVHTVKGCWNHGDKWKAIADKLNNKYGYGITRVGSKNNNCTTKTAAKSNMKYQIQCTKCGNIWYRQKLSRLVEHPEKYRCKCGGNLKRIK